MSWVRLDDGAPGHRKIVGLSDAAFRLWIVGLTYCNQQANDGRFSAASARIMTGYLASPELGRGAMAELCAAGLWAETADGFEVHDYLEYQPSQEEQSMCLLMQRTWPEWWPFLTKQTNELPEV